MFGYRMATGERDQLYLWFMFRSSIDRRCPVRVTYFKRKKDARRKPVVDRFGHPVYARVTRVVEPYELGVSRDGARCVWVVDRSPEGVDSSPAYRVIRLDRVSVRLADGRPVLTRMMSHGFLCPSPLDGRELHPRKGALNKRKRGILLAL